MLAILPFIFGNWLIAAIMTTVTAIAFYMGVAYLGGKLFGPDIPEADTGVTPDAQSRSWNPHSTQQEGIARPRAYGKNMHHGNVVAKWTDVISDEREVLHLIVEHGEGPTKGIVVVDGVKQVFLNDQPAANFGNVTIQERLGTLNQTCMTGFEKSKLEYELNSKLEKDEPIIFTTPNDYFDDLEYTIVWPNGLRKYHKSGGMDYSSCVVKIRIREHPDGGWTEIFNQATTVRQNAPLFKLHTVSDLWPHVERGKQYDLEFTNLTGPSERHVNDVCIRSVREVIDIPFTRPGKALVGITAIATTQLSGRLDVKVVREDKLVDVYDGTNWSIKYSRNRAWVVYDALTQPVISGEDAASWVIEHYEGFNPSYLDLEFFYNWAEFCSVQVPDGYGGTEDRIACDTILDYTTDVWSFVQEIANIGRAYLYWQGHLLTGWIDTAMAVGEVTPLVTMDNIMARTWKNVWSEKDELAGRVEVFFQDSRQGYERTHAPLPNESAGRYTRIISIEGVGITTRGTAIHVANHALKRNELIRNVNNFRQYKDALRYKLGDVVRIQHKTPNWGEGHRVIRSTANNKVTLDRHTTANAGELLFVQSYDETEKKVRTVSYTIESVVGKVVTIVETWDVKPAKNNTVAIGVDGAIVLRRVVKIEPTVTNYFDITVETYDTTLFTADDLDPNNPDRNYIWGRPANPLTRPVTRQEVIEMINQTLIPQLDVDAPSTSNCKWAGSLGTTVAWSKEDATEPIQFRYKGTTYEIDEGSTTDEFIYWDPNFTTSFRHTNDAAVAVAYTAAGQRWYMCRNVAGVEYPTTPFPSVHAGVLQVGTITAAYGQLANLVVTTGKIADLAVETLKIKDEAVTLGVSAYTNGTTGHGDIQSLEITTTGQPVTLIGSGRVKAFGAGTQVYMFRIFRDDVEVYSTANNIVPTYVIPFDMMVTIAFREIPPADTYTYTLKMSGGEVSVEKRFLYAQEVKK